MIAYKGFNKNLQATMGKGIFSYEIGKTYEEASAQCVRTGFHCVEEPIEVLSWYKDTDSRYCVVKAEGDIHEDGQERISCTKLTLIKEIDRIQLATHECRWMQEHPERKYSEHIAQNKGTADKYFVIVRGKNPMARGKKGAVLFLVKEYARSKKIKEIAAYEVDGKTIKENTYYDTEGKEAEKNACKGKTQAVKTA